MILGYQIVLKATRAVFRVEVIDGQRGIVRSDRTGGRLLLVETDRGLFARRVVDNGASGSLFDSLTPVGPRYACQPLGW